MALNFDTYGGSNSIMENIGSGIEKGWQSVKDFGGKIADGIGGILDIFPGTRTPKGQIEKINEKNEAQGIERIQEKTADTQGEQSTDGQEKSESEILQEYLNQAEKLEQKEIEERKHAEEREDTAYQRAITDMRKAGWNTDGLQPQASASAARLDSSRSEATKDRTEQQKDRELKLKMLYKELDQAVKENKKDRVLSIVQSIMSLGGTITGAKILGASRK